MILLELPDVLAVAARVIGCDSGQIVETTDLDDVELTLTEAVTAAEIGDIAHVAAELLGGLVRRKPFRGPNRRIALTVTLQLLALNDLDLDLDPVEGINLVLDSVAEGAQPSMLATHVRIRLQPLRKERKRQKKPSGLAALMSAAHRGERHHMFERFTDRARSTVVLAQEEARLLSHNYIGTEHVLLGLLREQEGLAARALESVGISLEAVRTQVLEIIGEGAQAPVGHIPFTPRAKKVLDLSLREAVQLKCDYVGTEHILLGIVREGEGVAAQVLFKLGADLNTVRQRVVTMEPESGQPRDVETTGRRVNLLREIKTLFDENDRLRAETEGAAAEIKRLRALLVRHGIDPES
ncbi:hypothetical protein GCM10023317_67180 [Actinopolymorpha pittospori]|uniref:Prophage maintenance system killer protein n=1 Tax=Actinopolymorpha pittospori TaxID=648752 RepID=A0A927N202_9ACTN|nr:prophage maintenance system killer protein [Actinopolymorpha pittospori]